MVYQGVINRSSIIENSRLTQFKGSYTIIHDGDGHAFSSVAHLPGLSHVEVQPWSAVRLSCIYLINSTVWTCSYELNTPGVFGHNFIKLVTTTTMLQGKIKVTDNRPVLRNI